MLAADREPGDLTLDERQLKAANPGRLTRAVNVRNVGLLILIDSHAAVFNHTSEQLSQLDIRHEMKTTREIITRYFSAARQRHAFEFAVSFRRSHPTTIQVFRALPLRRCAFA